MGWIVAVAALVLTLSGCGGGGTASMGGPGDDAGEASLLDKWQRFEDGAPTLRMTDAQVSRAWRSVARTSTHRVIRAGPVSVGNDPGSDNPVATDPAFPAGAEACAPGECGVDPRPDSTWAFAPVLEHRDIPVAEFTSRFAETRILEAGGEAGDRQTQLFDSLTYGGWLDHMHFNVSVTRWCTIGLAGCSETDDTDPVYAGGGVLGFMAGSYSGSAPTGAGSATWSGIMVGMEVLAPDLLQRQRPAVFLGNARVTIDDLAAPDADVSFTVSTTSPREPGIGTCTGRTFPSRTACSAGYPTRPARPPPTTWSGCSPAWARGSGRHVSQERHRGSLRSSETAVALDPDRFGNGTGNTVAPADAAGGGFARQV